MKRITPERAAERRQYRKQVAAYLAAHPYDMFFIACRGLDEATVIKEEGWCAGPAGTMICAPASTTVHHRGKCRGARLLDERWWMACSMGSHDFIESHKSWAREEGYLLPIQADPEGRWGDGNQALTTPELMKSKEAKL